MKGKEKKREAKGVAAKAKASVLRDLKPKKRGDSVKGGKASAVIAVS